MVSYMTQIINEEAIAQFLNNMVEDNIYQISNKKVDDDILTTSILFSIETGGSTGGDCWGGRTAGYDIGYDERKKNLFDSLKKYYHFDELFDNTHIVSNTYMDKNYQESFVLACMDLAEKSYTSSVTSKSDYYDYYGNGRDYDIIAINLHELMEKILSPSDFTLFEDAYKEFVPTILNKLDNTAKTEQLIMVTQKITDFETQSNKDLSELQNDIKATQKRLQYLEKNYSNFNAQKEKTLASLVAQKEQLLNEGIKLPLSKKNTY